MKSWQKALLKIDRAFADAGVFYALGGSAMLCLRGLESTARDLDLFVRFEDKDKAQALLCSIGEQMVAPAKPEYETKHFSKFLIDDVETDLMAEFAVTTDHGVAHFPSHALSAEPILLAHAPIPCMRLEDWLYLYLAIGRAKRVQALATHFLDHPIDRDRMLELLGLPMPEELSRTLREILEKAS